MWGLKTRRSSIWRVAFTPVAFADADAPEKEGEAEVIGGAGSVSPLAEGSDPGGPLLLDLSATVTVATCCVNFRTLSVTYGIGRQATCAAAICGVPTRLQTIPDRQG